MMMNAVFPSRIHRTLVATALVLAPLAADAGDAARGKKIFEQCRYCHDPLPDAPLAAPDLKGVFGRPAGAVPGYRYSDAMAAKNRAGLIWTEENLHAFVRNPKGFVPGTVMPFKGVKRKSMREDLFTYLKTLGTTND
ncbi:c-type cytochrome [Minwuia sp.]|uniref:c-type cytochrome n=1 Tax=Minwuia sp. TaxID=2493630 RepID=UPI003A92094F